LKGKTLIFKKSKEVVNKPDWGSFRKFWNDCELTITPVLKGFIDIEGGHVGIASQWLASCFECINSTSCEICGRNPNNYLQVRAGDGDGAYGVYELKFEQEKVGGMVVLDEYAEMAGPIINSIDDMTSNQNLTTDEIETFFQDFYQYFYGAMDAFDPSMQLLKIGEMELKENDLGFFENSGTFVIGESGEGKDSNQSLITLNDLKVGNYRFFAFGYRDDSNSNIFLPRMVLFLRDDAADQIGFTNNFAPSMNMESEIDKWGQSLVNSRMGGPLAPVMIKTNLNWIQINLWADQMRGEGNYDRVSNEFAQLEQRSWFLMLYQHEDGKAFRKNAEKVFKEHAKSLNTLHRLRGQFGRKIY
jgi:hypothetical protein